MRIRFTAFIFSLFFAISSVLALYGKCALATNRLSPRTKEESSIRCQDVTLNSNLQGYSQVRFQTKKPLSKVLAILNGKIDYFLPTGRFKVGPSSKLLSQKGLYRYKEVYRL